MTSRASLALLLAVSCSSGTPAPPAQTAASVVVTPATSTIQAGQTVQLTAAVTAADGTPLTNAAAWTSSNTSSGTVSGTGLVVGVAAGVATITATAGSASGSATVTVTAPVSGGPVPPALSCKPSTTSLLEHHSNSCRDGRFQSASLTRAAAATLQPDATFKATLAGQTFYAQPLYFPGGPGGKTLVIVASEQNIVTALDAADGSVVWQTTLGTPVALSKLPCGNIDPLGVTGTPVIDASSRTLFAAAMTTPDNGSTKKQQVFALSLDDGSVRPDWPVDIGAKATFGQLAFNSSVQNQRGALAFVNGTVYVPYSGFFGDCGGYHGWVVAVPSATPQSPTAWATQAAGGGIWGPSGVASDGTSVFTATGNTFTGGTWGNGEALLRFNAGAALADSYAPANWQTLDNQDLDVGGSGIILLDIPNSTPSNLAVSLGKNGSIYLLARNSLGGIGGPAVIAPVASNSIVNAAAAYTTALGTYVVFRGRGTACPAGQSGDLTAVKINQGSPPTVTTAWCAQQNGSGSPMVTSTDGSAESIVWSLGAGTDQKLHAFNGDTGAVIFTSAALGSVSSFMTPIVGGGRIFVAANGSVQAFAISK